MYQALFRRVGDWISVPRGPKWVSIAGKLILGPLTFLTLVVVALQLGAWRKNFDIAGPFAAETRPPQHSLILAVPEEGPLPWWWQPLNSDSLEKPHESRLRLRINGRDVGPAHSAVSLIREGKTNGFNHSESGLIFSLPPDARNASETVATISYRIEPRPWLTAVLLVATLSLTWLLYHEALRSFVRRSAQPASPARRAAGRLAVFLLPLPYLLLSGLCCLGLAGTVLFVGSSLYALANGWALPTTAPIRLFPIIAWAARNEPYFGQLLLMIAGFGTLVSWFAFLVGQAKRSVAYELKLRNFLRWCGIPIVTCAFVLCTSAMWAGMVRLGDPHWANIGGLIPYSDAHGHLADAYYQARDGTWAEFAARRPLAAAFREVLVFFSDYSFPITLVLQASLLAFATCFASYRVLIWRGVWAGLAFFGFAYIYIRVFTPTSLTEPLGLFWSLLSIAFFVESFRTSSIIPALAGFAMTATALMIRMGSMFTIPALLLWLVWQFGRRIKAKLEIAAIVTGILVAVFGVNSLLQRVYGTLGAETGGNFSYVLCGLTIGTTWVGCPEKLAEQGKPLSGDEANVARQLYAFAWNNIRARPGVFFDRLIEGATTFVAQFRNVLWRGYNVGIVEPAWLFRGTLTGICLIGLAYIAARRASRGELVFWALLWASIVASSAIVYFDDGARVLAASHQLIALFFAMGMVNPALCASTVQEDRLLTGCGLLGLVLAAALFVCVPWIGHKVDNQKYSHDLKRSQDGAIVFGGRRMSGFLVIADGESLRTDTSSIHFADFKAIVTQAGIYQILLEPFTPALPFGFVFASRMERGAVAPSLFLVPADVLERHDVEMWHFVFDPDRGRPSLWPYVTKAEPWPH